MGGQTSLCLAHRFRKTSLISILSEYGASAYYCFEYCIEQRDMEELRYLLDATAGVNAISEGWSPLLYALQNQRDEPLCPALQKMEYIRLTEKAKHIGIPELEIESRESEIQAFIKMIVDAAP